MISFGGAFLISKFKETDGRLKWRNGKEDPSRKQAADEDG